MNREEQIKFIEDNYPATTNHISNRRIRHDFFSSIETELQAYLLGFYTADGNIDEKRKTPLLSPKCPVAHRLSGHRPAFGIEHSVPVGGGL